MPTPAAEQPAATAPALPLTKPIVSVGAYSQRERHSQSLEEAGTIKFEYLTNDGSQNSNLRCAALLLQSVLEAAAAHTRGVQAHRAEECVHEAAAQHAA